MLESILEQNMSLVCLKKGSNDIAGLMLNYVVRKSDRSYIYRKVLTVHRFLLNLKKTKQFQHVFH